MNNRVTLAQLNNMPSDQVNDLSFEQVAMLLEDVADLKAETDRAAELLHATMCHRFLPTAATLRCSAGKDTGTVSLLNGAFIIRADLPKKVEWNEAELIRIEAKLAATGEPIEDYIKVKRTVAEGAYAKWPSSLRATFEPARTVSAGKPTFKVDRVGAKRGA